MYAGAGYWSYARTAEHMRWAAKREQERKEGEAARRKAHRALPKRDRMLKDLDAVAKKLDSMRKLHWTQRRKRYGSDSGWREACSHQLRRWNRLVRALNAYVGTSQQVPEQEV